MNIEYFRTYSLLAIFFLSLFYAMFVRIQFYIRVRKHKMISHLHWKRTAIQVSIAAVIYGLAIYFIIIPYSTTQGYENFVYFLICTASPLAIELIGFFTQLITLRAEFPNKSSNE